MAGGRSRQAAPLERLDVPPAGLSGRSRSCPNRSPWQPAQAPELPGWESSAGCRGCCCPSAGRAAPATGGVALTPGHGTPWQDAAPWGILPSVLPQGRWRQRAGTGPGALDCAQAAGIGEGLCRAFWGGSPGCLSGTAGGDRGWECCVPAGLCCAPPCSPWLQWCQQESRERSRVLPRQRCQHPSALDRVRAAAGTEQGPGRSGHPRGAVGQG